MTIGKKLHNVIGNLKGAAGDLQTFALETDNANAKQMYTTSSQQLDQIVNQLSNRAKQVEAEEPQYSMSHMAQQAVQKQQAQQQLKQERGDSAG